jgi:hypothetical protein
MIRAPRTSARPWKSGASAPRKTPGINQGQPLQSPLTRQKPREVVQSYSRRGGWPTQAVLWLEWGRSIVGRILLWFAEQEGEHAPA